MITGRKLVPSIECSNRYITTIESSLNFNKREITKMLKHYMKNIKDLCEYFPPFFPLTKLMCITA